MAALPSRVAEIVGAENAVAFQTKRIADLPINFFRLWLLIVYVLTYQDNNEKFCELTTSAKKAEFLKKAMQAQDDDDKTQTDEAIAGLGLINRDLLDLADLFCANREFMTTFVPLTGQATRKKKA